MHSRRGSTLACQSSYGFFDGSLGLDPPEVVDWAAVNAATTPPPVIPDYQGPNIRGIVPALLGPADWRTGVPAWMPEEVRHARQAVLLVLDGLGWDQLQDHRQLLPTVGSMNGGPITSVAPTIVRKLDCMSVT